MTMHASTIEAAAEVADHGMKSIEPVGTTSSMRRYSALVKPNVFVELDQSALLPVADCCKDENDVGRPLPTACCEITSNDIQEPPLVAETDVTPEAEAYPVADLEREDSSDSLGSAQAVAAHVSPFMGDTIEAVPVEHMRPEFVYVKVIKPSANCSLGVFLQGRRGEVTISRIDPDGLLGKFSSIIRPGDVVVAVNGYSCVDAKPSEIAKYVKRAPFSVSLLVRNKNGHPQLLSSTVQKPAPDAKAGFAVRSDRGAIVITRVHASGLFAGSLLAAGHRFIEVNGHKCDDLSLISARDAVDVIQQSPDFVTIVSRPTNIVCDTAMVVSCDTHPGWWRHAALAVGPAQTLIDI